MLVFWICYARMKKFDQPKLSEFFNNSLKLKKKKGTQIPNWKLLIKIQNRKRKIQNKHKTVSKHNTNTLHNMRLVTRLVYWEGKGGVVTDCLCSSSPLHSPLMFALMQERRQEQIKSKNAMNVQMTDDNKLIILEWDLDYR